MYIWAHKKKESWREFGEIFTNIRVKKLSSTENLITIVSVLLLGKAKSNHRWFDCKIWIDQFFQYISCYDFIKCLQNLYVNVKKENSPVKGCCKKYIFSDTIKKLLSPLTLFYLLMQSSKNLDGKAIAANLKTK